MEAVVSNEEIKKLIMSMHLLKEEFDKVTMQKYNRINPFVENVFDWKEKGDRLFGMGKNVTVYDTCSIAGNVTVGENTWIGPYTAIDGNGNVKIGKYCSISSHVNIVSHDSVKYALTGGKHPYEYAPIEIGDYCFIGTGAVLTKGIRIGNHCLIGAGAVVTKDIPDFSIVYGVPAKIVGRVIISGNDVLFEYD